MTDVSMDAGKARALMCTNGFGNTSKKYMGSVYCRVEGKCTDGEMHGKAHV